MEGVLHLVFVCAPEWWSVLRAHICRSTQGVTEGPLICGQYWVSSSTPSHREPTAASGSMKQMEGLIGLILTGS